MKKTLFGFMALATAFAAVSCQSDEEFEQQPTNKPMVINAVAEGIGAGTRAEMAYKYDILWNDGDEIFVKDNGTNTATFTLTAGSGTTNGTFACEACPFANGAEVEAFYPASVGESLVWPAKQTTNTIIPMYSKKNLGSTGSENFSFASLGSVLQIVFNTEQTGVTLKSITLKDGTNPLSGTFTVNDDGKAVMDANADAPGITYDLGETGKKLGKGANYFNIAVPAGTYSDLSITFTATDNTVCTLKGSVTINHNTVGKLILTGFTPTAGVAAANGVGYVKWVQLWKGGPKFAEFNVGAKFATDYGGYYTWGGTYNNNPELPGFVWTDDHNKDSSELSGDNDTATKLWGSKWRMPTRTELQGLINSKNCDVEWFDGNKKKYNNSNVAGRLCTGKGDYSSNSVFLPAASECYFGDVRDRGSDGFYWSSTPDGVSSSYFLNFNSGHQGVSRTSRLYGYSVRAVLAE